jgi:hypothetical protein
MPEKPPLIVRLSEAADAQFVKAFGEIAARIAAPLSAADRTQLPVKMYLAGGAAVHFYTGARTTGDIDAVFSRRLLLPDDLDVNYIDAKGQARLLYFDRQYNDTLALMHEDAQDDAIPLPLVGVDPKLLEVRLLAPVDLAVSKIGRFEVHDQEDIAALARERLITAKDVRKRAEEALRGYVGNVSGVRVSIELAMQLIAQAATPRKSKPR